MFEMRCNGIRYDIPDYLNGKLDPESASLVKEHLESCASCRSVADRLAPITTILASSDGKPSVNVMVLPAVNARIDAATSRNIAVPGGVPRFVTAFASGFAAILCAVLLLPSLFTEDANLAFTNEMHTFIGNLDSAAIYNLELFIDEHPTLSSPLSTSESMEQLPDITTGAIANELFADMQYKDVVGAASDYLATDDLYAYIPDEVIPSSKDSR
jgi:hypothetical protein